MPSFDEVVAFHGHLCLDIAMGYRVASAARSAMPKGTSLVAVVENDTCAVDAVQAVTGCTFGKRNLVPQLSGKPVYTLQQAGSGDGVRIYVHFWENFDTDGRFRATMSDWKNGMLSPEDATTFESEHQRQIDHILTAPQDELFRITPIRQPPPPKSGGFASAPCQMCAEHTKQSLLVNGVCGPCRSIAR